MEIVSQRCEAARWHTATLWPPNSHPASVQGVLWWAAGTRGVGSSSRT